MLIRNTASVILGRAVMGFTSGIFIFNAIPCVVNNLPDIEKYFYGSLAIIISRLGPISHSLTYMVI